VLAAVGQLRLLLVPPSQPLARLEERDELAERLREVRAVDLVDDEDAFGACPPRDFGKGLAYPSASAESEEMHPAREFREDVIAICLARDDARSGLERS